MKKKKPVKIADGCVGCEDEPAFKGQLGSNCKYWINYHEVQSHAEKARYIGKVRKASNRISSFLVGGRRKGRAA